MLKKILRSSHNNFWGVDRSHTISLYLFYAICNCSCEIFLVSFKYYCQIKLTFIKECHIRMRMLMLICGPNIFFHVGLYIKVNRVCNECHWLKLLCYIIIYIVLYYIILYYSYVGRAPWLKEGRHCRRTVRQNSNLAECPESCYKRRHLSTCISIINCTEVQKPDDVGMGLQKFSDASLQWSFRTGIFNIQFYIHTYQT